MPPKDPTIDYAEQEKTLTIANVILQEQISELKNERKRMHDLLSCFEQPTPPRKEEAKNEGEREKRPGRRSSARESAGRSRRYRRTASEIDRPYKCPFEPCTKAYGYALFS